MVKDDVEELVDYSDIQVDIHFHNGILDLHDYVRQLKKGENSKGEGWREHWNHYSGEQLWEQVHHYLELGILPLLLVSEEAVINILIIPAFEFVKAVNLCGEYEKAEDQSNEGNRIVVYEGK